MTTPETATAAQTVTPSTCKLSCEHIGGARPWVAEIAGIDDTKFGLKREFVNGIKDYSRANSKKTRGVMTHYTLSSGKVYEISDPHSWGKTDRYFAIVEDGQIKQIDASLVAKMVGGAK